MAKVVTKLRLRGFLSDRFSSQLEQSYLGDEHVHILKDVDCEMQFVSDKGFVRHETELHSYLPVFHLIGSVTEIVGDFPYGVNRIYFSDSDKTYLSKDIAYYPSPREISHMVVKGGFFTGKFKIPNLMSANTYSFPVKVDLIVIPPDGNEDVGSDRMSVPIFYVKLKGTGVTRKTDKLLDYYGIDIDPLYPSYTLTAESSGYTDPPLMEYIEEIKYEVPKEDKLSRDQYITPEEEAEVIRFQEQQASVPMTDMQVGMDAVEPSEEDVMLAAKSREIGDRVMLARQKAVESKANSLQPTVDQSVEMSIDVDKTVSDDNGKESVSSQDLFDNGVLVFPDENAVEQPVVVTTDFDTVSPPVFAEISAEESVQDVLEMDSFEQRDMNAADVVDADAQAELEEERVSKNALATAVEIQQEVAEESDVKYEQHIPSSFLEIADSDECDQENDSMEPC